MVGAIVGSTAAVWLGAVQWFPESAIWAWPLVTNPGVYMAGIALGGSHNCADGGVPASDDVP